MELNRLKILQSRKVDSEALRKAIRKSGTNSQKNELKLYSEPILDTVNREFGKL